MGDFEVGGDVGLWGGTRISSVSSDGSPSSPASSPAVDGGRTGAASGRDSIWEGEATPGTGSEGRREEGFVLEFLGLPRPAWGLGLDWGIVGTRGLNEVWMRKRFWEESFRWGYEEERGLGVGG